MHLSESTESLSSLQNQNELSKRVYPVYNNNNVYVTKDIIENILKIGGVTKNISNLDIWQKAFVNKSYCKNTDRVKMEKFYGSLSEIDDEINMETVMPLYEDSNEVFEWLGDGIIQSVVAVYLCKRFKNQREGFLTKLRSKLVKTESLSKFALFLGFDKYLVISKHVEIVCNGRKNSRILEDCFEAFIGALMMDFGFEQDGYKLCSQFIINIIEKSVDITELIIHDDNFKDQLMKHFQKIFGGKFPIYEQKVVQNEVTENGIINKRFHMFVCEPEGKVIGEGVARSKKEAEQKAAKSALMHYGLIHNF
jgi:ribonuclease-3